MIQTTYGGKSVFVANDSPNWNYGFSVDFACVSDNAESLTKHDARRPYAQTLRTQISSSATISDATLRSLQSVMRGLKAQQVLYPFWPAVSFWSSRASMKITGGLNIVYKADWSQYEIYTTIEPGWPAAKDLVVPLLGGFLDEDSKNNTLVGVACHNFGTKFIESSDAAWALAFTSGAFATGPTPTGYGAAPTLFPVKPDFSQVAETLSIQVKRDDVNFRRQKPATFYPHEVFRIQESQYTLDGAATIASFLNWFQTTSGPGASFWAATSMIIGVLAADVISSATSLTLTDATLNVKPNDYICAFVSSGAMVSSKVLTVLGSVITIDNAFGAAMKAGQTFYLLALAKLSSTTISTNWLSPVLVQATIKWEEVIPEAYLPGGETLGTTIGLLPMRAVLFQCFRDYGNGTVITQYFTSFESDIPYSGHDYLSSSFECKEIATSLNMQEDSCTFETKLTKEDGTLDSSNPLLIDAILGSEAPLNVTITFVDYDGVTVSNPVQVFSGEVESFSRKGNSIVATCRFGSAIFENELPVLTKGTVCSHLKGSPGDGSHLISQGCTGPDVVMKRSNWKCTGQVAAVISSAFPFALHLTSLTGVGAAAAAAIAGSRVFVSWFAYGWVEWGTGADVQRRLIVASTVPVAGVITLNLHRYFSALPSIGDVVTFYPGCDGQRSTCKAYDASTNQLGKFDNYLNIGADPFTPKSNPTVTGQQNLGVQGGKK